MSAPTAPKPTALVLGATGGFGGAAAAALIARGWRVRALQRDPDAARAANAGLAVDWVKGDAMVAADVRRTADGAQAIVHAVNPPAYRNWAGTVLPMMENTIAAARAEGARILVPGSVYNYGPDARGQIAEDAAQNPPTRKGRIRAALERRLREAGQDGVKSVLLRAGDFFGVGAKSNWIGAGVIQAGKPVRSLSYPGPLALRHAWAYLPDLGEAAARLLDREADLAAVASCHFGGHALTGDELVAAFETTVGRKLPVRSFPWLAIGAMGAFNETLRELSEMRYLWRETVLLDNARLTATIGAEPHTPITAALGETLRGLGCLEHAEAQAA
jgi:nucleoside-diphosphate-sugar epimerase